MNAWEAVIGLETHVQLCTRSKIFSGAATAYGAAPNTQACAVDLGLPGVLPVLNAEVVSMAIKFGLAVEAQIAERPVFARKNYFYPDLPKGYQISQYELPIVSGGKLHIELEDGSGKTIRITRAHLEEDAGKSVHEGFGNMTGIDLNRAGTPLMEIVTEPDLRSAADAAAYMKKIHTLVRYLGISDGNMQEGSFRCDANVSVRRMGTDQLGTRVEVKNLNSFRFVEQAIDFEIRRQTEVLEAGGTIKQETRLFDSDKGETRPMRVKEEANDYRYFPDPDLLPLLIDRELVASIQSTLPEFEESKRQRFIDDYGLSEADSRYFTADPELADLLESEIKAAGGDIKASAKACANLIKRDLAAALKRDNLTLYTSRVSPGQIGDIARRIVTMEVSATAGSTIFSAIWNGEGDVGQIIDARGLKQVSDPSLIEKLVDEVIAANAAQVEQYRQGKDKVLAFLVGQVMKKSQGKANPQQVNDLMRKKLSSK